MKSYLKCRYGLITTSVLAATVLATGWQSTSVLAENPTTSPTTTVTSNGFSFQATLLDRNGKTVAGKTVSLYDITEGKNTLVQSITSNQDGIALFTNLPLNRNLSVSIDDVAQGYTTRTSESGQVRSSAFYIDGQGTNTPKYSDKTITISVLNEEAEPLANQKVTLTNPLKEVVGEAMTDADGNVVFKDKLLDGVFYNYAVNGKSIDSAQPDSKRSVFLESKQVDRDGFTFKATVLGQNGKTVAGKTVSLYDITEGKNTLVQSITSNQDGIALFTNLPLNRNLSVSIDDVAQGYTIRTSENGQVRSSAFYVDGQGAQTPKYSDKTITISVLNEEGEPLANQKVTLINPLKEVIGDANTDADGKVIFSDKLLDGVFYNYAVNDQTIDATQPDTSRSVFLRADQILKESPKNTASEAATNLEKTSESKEGNMPQQNQSEAKEKAPEKQVDANGANKKAPGHGEVKKGLPMAGERGGRLFTFIGLSLILGIAGYLLKHKKVKS
ncbi:LPXTG cell wall anchor domain-containing protein [Streptococcus uberis]|nr:LPXTG cell wall anchor domain-containing protein [Streptococcus uberis]MCK1200744.1 LPXTG cell wall anchor domain-containing protein [Streptococcus uberis]